MRKIITIAILLFSIASYAQHNLEFNQVLNIKNGDTYTVPSGKTLKITSVVSQNATAKIPLSSCYINGGGYATCNYSGTITLGSISNLIYTSGNMSTGFLATNNQCSQCPATTDMPVNGFGFPVPLWLKSGEVVSIAQGTGMLISAIEFNIVQ